MFTIRILQKKHSQIPTLDLDLLLAHAINQPREFLYTHPDYRLSLTAYCLLLYFIWQYHRGYAVAAITHHKEFYGLDFYVNKYTLIPRPETELMVDSVIEEIKKKRKKEITLIDVGTGSGCIPIAILKTIKQYNNITIKPFATDISSKALSVAKKNARTQNVSIPFLKGNLLGPFIKQSNNETMRQWGNETILITANLPYLTAEQFQQEPSIQKEPYQALVAKKQGLALYEELLHQITQLTKIYNLKSIIFLEIDPSQSLAITKLINQTLPQASVEIKKDLGGHNRLVVIRAN